ncbi:MAG: hypothetical protein ABF629_14445 [Sporolactobacillus sp.]
MEITLCQSIMLQDRSMQLSLYKTIESDYLPHQGDYISDSAFPAPYEHEIKKTVINYECSLCSVYLTPIQLSDKENMKRYLKQFKQHGWIDQLFKSSL